MPISDRMMRSSNCVAVCVDETKNGFKGRVYNCYNKDPQHFNDVTEMFYIIENVLDALNFPALKTKDRGFKKTDYAFSPVEIDLDKKFHEVENLIPDLEREGYIIMVTSRDNVTWQGVVYDKKNDVECSFNSEEELIKLIK